MLGFEIFVRIIAILFLALNYRAFRRTQNYLKTFQFKGARGKVIRHGSWILAIMFNIPWVVILVFGLRYRMGSAESVLIAAYTYPFYAYQFTVFVLAILSFFKWVFRLLLLPVRWLYRRVFLQSVEAESTAAIRVARRSFLKKSGILVPSAVLAATTYGMFKSQLDYVIREIEIPIENLPERLKGYTITQLSDFHVGPFVGQNKLREMVATANEIGSDLIVITGDVVNDSTDVLSHALPELARLRARDGIFFCMGNHDYIADRSGTGVINGMKSIGAKVLVNESAIVSLNDELVCISGLNYIGSTNSPGRRYFLNQTMKDVQPDGYPGILLAHHPIIFDEVSESDFKIDLVLSGHTHGGQIVLAEIGDFVVSPMFGHKYLKGEYRSGNKTLYVNSGLGHWLPVRINCPPEFTKVTLV